MSSTILDRDDVFIICISTVSNSLLPVPNKYQCLLVFNMLLKTVLGLSDDPEANMLTLKLCDALCKLVS